MFADPFDNMYEAFVFETHRLPAVKGFIKVQVVTMIKGEFQSKTIDAQKLLKQSKDNTIIVPFLYDKQPEIGPIQVGDLFFACVSADELNPPEGTECEHRVTIHMGIYIT